jgi:hypothetical protein
MRSLMTGQVNGLQTLHGSRKSGKLRNQDTRWLSTLPPGVRPRMPSLHRPGIVDRRPWPRRAGWPPLPPLHRGGTRDQGSATASAFAPYPRPPSAIPHRCGAASGSMEHAYWSPSRSQPRQARTWPFRSGKKTPSRAARSLIFEGDLRGERTQQPLRSEKRLKSYIPRDSRTGCLSDRHRRSEQRRRSRPVPVAGYPQLSFDHAATFAQARSFYSH